MAQTRFARCAPSALAALVILAALLAAGSPLSAQAPKAPTWSTPQCE